MESERIDPKRKYRVFEIPRHLDIGTEDTKDPIINHLKSEYNLFFNNCQRFADELLLALNLA